MEIDEKIIEEIRSNPNAVLSIHAIEKNRVSVVPGGGREKSFYVDGYYIPCDVVFVHFSRFRQKN